MLSKTNDNSKFNNEDIGALVIVKATKGATDTILYSEHAINVGSHNGDGEVDSYQAPQTHVWPRFWAQFVLEKQQVFDTFTGTNYLTFYSFSSLDLVVIRSLFAVYFIKDRMLYLQYR